MPKPLGYQLPTFFEQKPVVIRFSGNGRDNQKVVITPIVNNIACGVHALCYLVQIVPNSSECSVVFPKFGIVNIIDKTV